MLEIFNTSVVCEHHSGSVFFVGFVLFAPEKGEDTRHKIAEILRKKGIRLNRSEMENLVDEIAAEIKGEGAE